MTLFSCAWSSVGLNDRSNPVRGFGVWNFWRVRSLVLVDEPGFRRVRSLVFPNFGPGFGSFLAEQVRNSGFLEGFERVRSLVLVDKPGFE